MWSLVRTFFMINLLVIAVIGKTAARDNTEMLLYTLVMPIKSEKSAINSNKATKPI